MKIHTLLELIQTTNTHKKSDSNVFNDEKDNNKRINGIGRKDAKYQSGYYGRVYDKNEPHTITKANYVSAYAKEDPYFQYIKTIVDNKLSESNPFFPRVYNIRTVEDARGKVKYQIEIEKLKPVHGIDVDIMEHLLVTLFEYDDIETAFNISKYGDAYETLATAVELTCQSSIKSKEPLLNDACKVIRDIKKTGRFLYDLHSANIMVRLSPTPQLVIIDPLKG